MRSFLRCLVIPIGLLGPAASASYVDFVALPLSGYSDGITVGAQVMGVDVGISSVRGEGTPLDAGVSYAATMPRLDFTTGSYTGTNALGDLFFAPGGSLTLTDGPSTTLFSGTFAGATELLPIPGGFEILAGGLTGVTSVALDTFYGEPTGFTSPGVLSLNLAGTLPNLGFLSGDMSVQSVPEPASVVLLSVGTALALFIRRRNRLSGRQP